MGPGMFDDLKYLAYCFVPAVVLLLLGMGFFLGRCL